MKRFLSCLLLALGVWKAHGQVLFSDDFSRGSDPAPLVPPWQQWSNTFSITGGALRSDSGALNVFSFASLTNVWTNYTVQATIRFSSTSGELGGVGARFNPNTGAHYAALVAPEGSTHGPRTLLLVKVQYWLGYEYTNTTSAVMATATLPGVGTTNHTLALSVQGNVLSVSFDGTRYITTTDIESNPYQFGGASVDMYTGNNAFSLFVDNLTVTALPPVLTTARDLFTTTLNNTLTVAAPGVLKNDIALSQTNLTATKLSNPANGTLTFNSNGGFTYVPNNNFVGIDSFTYQASDGVSNSVATTVAIDVTQATNLFYDNFTRAGSGNSFAPWVTGIGEWTVSGGVLLGSGTFQDYYSDAYIPIVGADYSVQTRFSLPSGAWACGLSGRLDPYSGARYVANVYPETSPFAPTPALRLIKFHTFGTWSSSFTPMALVSLPAVGTSTHTLKMAFYGNTIDVYFDGNVVVHMTDNNVDGLPPYRTGCFGAHMYMYYTIDQATFDEYSVTPLPPVNTPPMLPALASSTIAPLTTLVVTNTATDYDLPANTFTYALQGAPAGAAIDANGIITWTPTAAQNFTTNVITTIVTDYFPTATNSQHLTATNSFTVVVSDQSRIALNSTALIAQSCTPTNSGIDPGETVTVLFSLKDVGPGNTSNLVATLLSGGGVSALSGPQSYGALVAGGAAQAQPFTFAASGNCGGTITATLQLQDGAANIGTLPVNFVLGSFSPVWTQAFDSVTAPALPAGWTTSSSGAESNWVTVTGGFNSSLNSAFVPDVTNIGLSDLVSPAIVLGSAPTQLSFANNYDFEPNTATETYDGGVLDIKIGNNAFTDILAAGGSFAANGYTQVVSTNYGNPLGGRMAWGASSGGYVTTIVNLPAGAAGQTIQLRWRCGTDNGNGRPGWHIDSVALSSTVCCGNTNTPPVLPTQANRTIAELTTLTVTNTASDSSTPPSGLTYSLLSPPVGAAIDTNGVITWTPSEAQGPGTNTLTTVVTDNGAPPLSATNSFNVTVQEINTAPVLPAQTNRTILGLASLVVTNTATDTDLPANPLSYTLQAGPTNAVIDTNGVISWTPVVSQVPSTNVFTTVVTDFNSSAVNAQHLSATNSFTVVAQAVHNGPALAVQTNRTVAELTALVVTNKATDNDIPPRSLTYSLVNPPAGAAIDTNGVITWTPSEAQGPGTNTLTSVVTDNGAPPLSATNSFSVTVQEINTAPVLPAQTNRTIVGLASLVVTNTATDTDLPVNPLSYTLQVGPTNAVIDTNGVISWTPLVSQVPGTNVFTTVVTDFNSSAVNAQHLSATNSFTVVVQAIHNGPALAAQTNRTVAELTALVVTNNATDNDIPPRSLTYSLVNPPAGAAIDTNGVITWTPNEAQGPGTNTLTTVVTDNGAPPLSATNSFSVTVQEINTAPVLPTQSNRTILGLASLVVTNTAIDTDLPANPLSYTLPAGPTNAVIDTNGVITWTPVVSQVPSTNVFTTVVTDFNAFAVNAQHLSSTNSFTVVVQAVHNGPALAAQTNRTVAELTALVVTNNATDNDIPPRSLTYSLVNPPAGAAIDTNGVITWTPSEAQGPGTNTLTTVVTDNGAPPLSATNSFSVTVQEINTAPVLPAQTNRTIVGLATLVVTNTATDTDLPANPLSYTLQVGPTNAVIDTNGVIAWTPVVSQVPSTNVFTTVVTDFNAFAVYAQHLSATNSFTVVVQAVHNGPALAAQTNRTVAELTALVVTNNATDSDIPPRTLTYSLVNPPAGAAIDTNGVITWTPSEAQGPGTNTLTTVVTDNGAPPLSATNSFSVTVEEINTAPVLPAQTNRTIVGLATLVVTNTATDTDLPANPLSYILEAGPTNAVIDTNGVITWTPVVSQLPSTNVFTTVVTDFNSSAVNAQHLSSTNTFTVVAEEIHNGPALAAETNLTVAELTTLVVTNKATDNDIPPRSLTYSLVNAPAGATIATNGVITWTPSEAQGPGTYTLTTVVTDNGTPPLSSTNSFEVIVLEINTAPVLPAQTNRTIVGLATLVVTNTATDTDLPANPLSYVLEAGPTNAVIDTNGVITWTPIVSQVPSTNVFTTVVTDFNSSAVNAQHLSATNSFTVVVEAVHNGPVLAVETNRTVDELTTLVVTNHATANDIPSLTLTYSLVNPPAGAAIDTNGVITWTPSEAQGPGTNTLTTIVTDNGTPPLSATNSFEVTVLEINTAPFLPAQTNRTIVGLETLVVTNTATDTDLPANPLSYTLEAGPTNAVIDTNGVISWTPVVSQVPSTNVFMTVVTDFNSSAVNAQHLSATNSFTVVVEAIHNAPALGSQPNRTVAELTTLVVTNHATANDIPPLTLTYSLVNPPAGAAIDTNGVITWTPSETQGPGTNILTTVVTDNGAPPLSATNSFDVIVLRLNPSFESIIQVGPSVILTWNSLTGRTYRLQYSEDLASNIWTDLPPDTTAMSTSSSATNEIGASPQRFYRVILLP